MRFHCTVQTGKMDCLLHSKYKGLNRYSKIKHDVFDALYSETLGY